MALIYLFSYAQLFDLLRESVRKDCQYGGMPGNLDSEWPLLTYKFSFDLLVDGSINHEVVKVVN